MYTCATRSHVAQCTLSLHEALIHMYQNGRTPLHDAADNGHADIVRMLVGMFEICVCESLAELFFLAASGADVNAMDKYGNTPLHRAAGSGYTAIVQALFDLGADLTLPTNVRIMLMCS